MEDAAIVSLFFARSEQAVHELDAKYGGQLRQLAFRILDSRDDAEECLNDAYLAVWNAIPPTRPVSLPAYLCKIVRNLALKCLDRRSAAKRGGSYAVALQELEDCLPAPGGVEETVEARELARTLEHFLDTLSREDRAIFLLRYGCAAPYAHIARQVGRSEKAVSVRLVRMRKKLRDYLQQQEGAR